MRSVLRRVVAGVAVLWGAVTLTFLAVALTGGNQVDSIIGPDAASVPGLREQVATQYGLDRPLVVQYADRLGDLATGDLGWSYQRNQPVWGLLADQVGPTLVLAATAAVTGLALAVLLAVATAGRGRAVRRAASALESLIVALPPFWLGIVLLSVFSFGLRWFPAFGADGPASLVLPALALALPIAGVLAQVMRQELEVAEGRPFALSARARGLGERQLLLRHTLRHALLPVTTLSAWTIGTLVGGAVLVEQVFSRPGLGRVLVEAVKHRDTPVVTAVVTLAALVFVVTSALADLLYPVIDARLRTEDAR
ncbi:ABC transporter permease [Saccharothrix saharensis]|uniref:ABC transporter permease n=1 Tax=Saccharothrix saharensis TaxID=571190 RepID=UPI003697F57D